MLLFLGGMVCATLVVLALRSNPPPQRELVQDDIDAAVLHTFETKTLPSRAAKAAELVREAVVRVSGVTDDPKEDEAKDGNDPATGKDAKSPPAAKDSPAGKDSKDSNAKAGDGKGAKDDKSAQSDKDSKEARNAKDPGGIPDMSKPGEKKGRVATGVVVLENGTILTSLHVVAGAKKITVTFSDGMESEAEIVGVQPENDLAVIRAKKVPDDQQAATLGSSMKLKPGDEVVAVGFPFGIGPSTSAGVVSGTNREFRSPEGGRALSKLIQFDAAVNPGNSGGPLVTMDGEVVGIVAALLNPTEARTFIGIGFAVTIESAGSAVGVPPF